MWEAKGEVCGLESPRFLQASQGILQENLFSIRLPANTAFSFPVVAQRGEELCDAMFCYETPEETEVPTAPRPFGWVLFFCRSGEPAFFGRCRVQDFVDTAFHPLDSEVELRRPAHLSAPDHARSFRQIYEVYEQLRQFAFESEPTGEQRSVMEQYRTLFLRLACIGHYPYYHALSPEFFDWLGLDLYPDPAGEGAEAPETPLKVPEEKPALSEETGRELLRRLELFSGELREAAAADRYREKLIDQLHAEVQSYKNGLIDELTLPLERDVIKLIDDVKKGAEAFGGKAANKENYRKLQALLEGFGQDLADLLYRHGVEPYEVPGREADVHRQKILATVPTTDPALDKKIAARLAPGWEKHTGVVRPERVSVYVYHDPER